MKFSRVTAAIMMASLSTPLLAASEQSVGTLTSASQGTIVARDGKLIEGHAGQALFAGDRVVTRGTSKASVMMSGCSVTLAPTSILTVSNAKCAQPQSFTAARRDDAEGAGSGSDHHIGTSSIIVAVLALAAVGGGVAAATSNTNTTPASP